ncbi:MAG TPA: SIMPL domain-containing protein [Kofleriaceae bacterium]|jgi:uncharacterized protein YggE
MKSEPSDLSLLHVSEVVNGHIRPTAATLHVTLTAFKFFSGNAALSKSEELRALADALKKLGLANDAMSLAGATLDVSTGLFSRSSSVTYRAQIRIVDIDGLGNVLEVIAEAKQARLTHVTWEYPASAPDALVADCAKRAAAKAKVMAAAVGIELGAVHQMRDETHLEVAMQQQSYLVAGMAVPLARKRGGGGGAMQSLSGELDGLDLAPTREVSVRVTLAYRLA